MKVCFLLQRKFAYLGHQIAINLKEDHGVDQFCGYVYLRSGYDFLKNQKDITYSSLLLDEELHTQYKTATLDLDFLKQLEKDYGIPYLWPYVDVDRIIRHNQLVREYPYDKSNYTHEEMMLMVQTRAKAIIDMLEKEKPDVAIFSVVGGLGSYLLYEIAKKKGIKIININNSRIRNRHVLSKDFAYFTGVDEKFEALKKTNQRSPQYAQAKNIIDEFRNQPKTYSQNLGHYLERATAWKQLDFLSPKKIGRYFGWLLYAVNQHFTSNEKNDFSYVKISGKIIDQVKRKFRGLVPLHNYYGAVDQNEDFAFFPLHFEPEISTMLYAPFYTDQLHIIKQIAKSLPLHFKLYVKEQPAMVGFRSIRFYRELRKIPNVKIIHPKTNTFSITPHAKLVVTITGTVGWEALMFKKPVITFGDVFYNKISMTKLSRDDAHLPYLVKHQLENFSYNEDELINYLGCILEDSVEVDLQYLWHKEPDIQKKKQALKPLTNLIVKQSK